MNVSPNVGLEYHGPMWSQEDFPGWGRASAPVYMAQHRLIAGVFTAGLEEVRARMPSPLLHPVRWGRGRAAVMVFAGSYPAVTNSSGDGVLAYTESAAMALVTSGEHEAPPYVPLLGVPMPESFRFGLFVLHMPLTWGQVGRDLGRMVWGLPKFTADITYRVRPGYDEVLVTEAGRQVWRMRCRTEGHTAQGIDQGVLYSDLEGSLLRTDMPERGITVQTRGGGCATLELGDHEVADDLRALGIDERGVAARTMPDRVAILGAPERIGDAVAQHKGYAGSEAEGRAVWSPMEGIEYEVPLVVVPPA